MAGVYQCSNRVASRQINIHVYGILKAIGSSVRLLPRREVVGHVQYQTYSLDTSVRPFVACQFRVGRYGIKYTSVRWKGGKFSSHPSLYEISYSADESNGFIWSNLTIPHPSFDQALYGKYKCQFNIVSGSMESAEVEITMYELKRRAQARKQAESNGDLYGSNKTPGSRFMDDENVDDIYLLLNLLSVMSLDSQISNNYSVAVIPPLVKRADQVVGHYSGEPFTYICDVVAYPPITEPITWSRDDVPIQLNAGGEPYVAGEDWTNRVRLETKQYTNDRLVFDRVLPEDRAVYSCFVKNSFGNATGAFFLRVKDRWSVLWPLIGIVLELLVLFVIIVVYELKRRAQARKQAESNGDLYGSNKTPGSRFMDDENVDDM
ncbi:hypothetical protein AHF37_07585 [Paragonimus kellicotti]|nr:hypothetical protein AHF37_07585 [Paragonimus kellicotti]